MLLSHQGAKFLLGLLVLSGGGELLVRGASSAARALGVPALIVGLTVVSIGTSAPELVVCVVSAWRNESALVLGNVVGSNIINVLVVVGIVAIIAPVPIRWVDLSKHVWIMLGTSGLMVAMSVNRGIGRVDAAVLLLLLGSYLWFAVVRARRHSALARETDRSGRPGLSRLPLFASMVILGLIGLSYGARWMVDSAVWMADQAGVSKAVVGLTIVAGGTSLPELATFIAAAFHRNQELAVGNVIGSNIFNILGILGVSALMRPIGVEPELMNIHYPVMIGTAILLYVVLRFGKDVSRLEGAGLLGAYAGYAAFLYSLTRGGE